MQKDTPLHESNYTLNAISIKPDTKQYSEKTIHMTYDEVTPYLNKIVRLNLKNSKRKIGWLCIDLYHEVSDDPTKEVHCVNVLKGKKLFRGSAAVDMKLVELCSEIIQIEDISKIHSPQ